MRIALGNPTSGIVENIVEGADLASVATVYPDHDCIPIDDAHPAEPGATYSRRATTCRVSRDGRQVDVARSACRIGR